MGALLTFTNCAGAEGVNNMSYTRQKSLIKIGGWKNVVFNYIILIPQIVNCTNCVTLRKHIIFSLHVQFLIEFNIDIYYLCKYAN